MRALLFGGDYPTQACWRAAVGRLCGMSSGASSDCSRRNQCHSNLGRGQQLTVFAPARGESHTVSYSVFDRGDS